MESSNPTQYRADEPVAVSMNSIPSTLTSLSKKNKREQNGEEITKSAIRDSCVRARQHTHSVPALYIHRGSPGL